MARERGAIPLRTRWERLDADGRRKVAVVAAITALLLAVLVVGLAGRDQPTERLLVGSPSTSGPTTSRLGTNPSGTPRAASDAPAPPPPGDASTTTPGAAQADAPAAGTASGTGGAGAGSPAADASPGGAVARNSGVFGGVSPDDPAGGSARGGRGSGSATGDGDTAGSTTTTTPVEREGTVTIDRDDNGTTVTLARGDVLVVRLEPDRGASWSDPASDGPALTLTSAERPDGVVTARFRAAQPGRVAVTATGTPTCTTATPPCLSPAETFRVTVEVTG